MYWTDCQFDTVFPLFMLLQRYTFWSNSQHNVSAPVHGVVVYATTKIHILKQFTTNYKQHHFQKELFMLLQRYTFWSNSQQLSLMRANSVCCLCYYKDTHFEAIHNLSNSCISSIYPYSCLPQISHEGLYRFCLIVIQMVCRPLAGIAGYVKRGR